ncbi:ALK and LTK ligand 1 [Dromiciops gliroides]|uniref:ALK and LTK ligand 1 n=1 Tax=Dromiciops gliroides TaxID=33562 RepID=UPI001CC71F58|nr:ALK and LTK ligand 1 [Dromiciops gliroides]
MRTVSEWPKLPALFLLFLALASQESQGSPRGHREAGAQDDKEKLIHLIPAPAASSSAQVPQQHRAGRVRSSSQRERVVYAATSSSSPSSSASFSEPPRDRERALLFSASSSSEPDGSWLLSSPRISEILPRDLNLKEKFIKHFTGPVTFSAECSKHFHRLYHNTRDCTIPAYYKRCARLLTRLALSPLCTQP